MKRSFDSLQRGYDNMSPDESMDDHTKCEECKEIVHDDDMHDKEICEKCYEAMPRCEKHGVLWSCDQCEDCECDKANQIDEIIKNEAL